MPDITVEQVLESDDARLPDPPARHVPDLRRRLRDRDGRRGRRRRPRRAPGVGARGRHRARPAVHGRQPEAAGRSCARCRPPRKKAYALAGIERPASRTSTSPRSTSPRPTPSSRWYENLGFCPMGDGGELIDAGADADRRRAAGEPVRRRALDQPVGATAMIRVAEAAMQVMGEAGEHQIAGRQPSARHRLRRQRLDRRDDPLPERPRRARR